MSQGPRHFEAVVVGSGFGGSIGALRLAEAGRQVLVLERGRRYRPGEFPRDVRRVDSLLWGYPARPRSLGLYDLRVFSGLAVVAASGVGGGSLIYANIHIRPDPVVFEDPRWPRSITRARLDPYYDRVAAMLGVAPVPSDLRLPKRDAFREAARRVGREIFDPDQAVAWQAPGVPGREACCLMAECEFGCQVGAKNSVDLTYLARAEALGAQVRTGCDVSHLEVAPGGYRVNYTEVATGARESVTADRVMLSAGTLGTNEIMLRSRAQYRTLPKVSAKLGQGFSGNGDFLGAVHGTAVDLEPWNGTDVTSVIRYFETAPQFTMAAPTFNRPVMEVLAGMGQPRLDWLRWIGPLAWPHLGRVLRWVLVAGLLTRARDTSSAATARAGRMTNLFAIGRDNSNGVVRLKRGHLDIEWNYAEENRVLIERMLAAMREVSTAYGGSFAPLLTWTLFRRIITVHPLGGCQLADSPEGGVVSADGEVHGYPGLFVADGSVVPASIGFHPAMTISALSEAIADAVVASYPR